MLVVLFIFNITGHYFVQQYLFEKADEKLSLALDGKKYSENQLIEIKVALNLPYYQNTNFQRQDGHITIAGLEYNFVERKIENGYLILRCIPNHQKQEIKKLSTQYFSIVNGISDDHNSKNHSSKTVIQKEITDYEDVLFWQNKIHLIASINNYPLFKRLNLLSPFLTSPEKPPSLIG